VNGGRYGLVVGLSTGKAERVRRKIVTVMVVTASLAVGLFALPLAVLVAKYLIDDERAELTHAADITALSVTADLARSRQPTTLLPSSEEDISLTYYDRSGRRVLGDGPAIADSGVNSALTGDRVTDGDPGGDFTVDVPVSDDDVVVGAVRATSSRIAAWMGIMTAWLIMAACAGATLGMVWLVARRQAGRLAAPLEQLSAVAAGIGRSPLDTPHPSGVPEIDDVADSLAESAHRVERTLARERAFSADASHQLRTPLAGLRLQLETALEGPDAKLRPAIDTAIDAADRLERTITDLLELSRDTPAADRALPLPVLLDELRRDHHSTLAASGRRLSVMAHDDLPTVAASLQAVRQVLGVLLDNAQEHGCGAVTLTARETTRAVAVDVADEGRIDAADDELFVRRSPSAAGHGIGLALARSLTEAEGGRLLLSRREPTTFTVLLPLVPTGEPFDAHRAC
jgi:signal transduction histidine kinase